MSNWIVVNTTGYTAAIKDEIISENSDSGFTIVLPPTPLPGECVKFLNFGGQVRLDRGTKKYAPYDFPYTSLLFAEQSQEVTLIFVSEAIGWVPTKNIITFISSGGGGSGGS